MKKRISLILLVFTLFLLAVPGVMGAYVAVFEEDFSSDPSSDWYHYDGGDVRDDIYTWDSNLELLNVSMYRQTEPDGYVYNGSNADAISDLQITGGDINYNFSFGFVITYYSGIEGDTNLQLRSGFHNNITTDTKGAITTLVGGSGDQFGYYIYYDDSTSDFGVTGAAHKHNIEYRYEYNFTGDTLRTYQFNNTNGVLMAAQNFTIDNIDLSFGYWMLRALDSNDYANPLNASIDDIKLYCEGCISADVTAPNVSLNTPIEGMTYLDSDRLIFNYTAVDETDTEMDCTLYINGSIEDTMACTHNEPEIFNLSSKSAGDYNWQVQACDDSPNCANSSEVRNFTINNSNAAPVLNVGNFTNNISVIYSNDSVSFSFQPTDATSGDVLNCTFDLGGDVTTWTNQANNTLLSVVVDINNSNNLDYFNYSCTDGVSVTASSIYYVHYANTQPTNVIAPENISLTCSDSFQVNNTPSDLDGDAIDIWLFWDGLQNFSWADSPSGNLVWRIPDLAEASHNFTWTIFDGYGTNVTNPWYFLTYTKSNQSLTAIANQSVANGSTFGYQAVCSDCDEDTITYHLNTSDADMSINATGYITDTTPVNNTLVTVYCEADGLNVSDDFWLAVTFPVAAGGVNLSLFDTEPEQINLSGFFFILQFLIIIGLLLLKLYNLMHKGEVYGPPMMFITFILFFLMYGIGFVVTMIYNATPVFFLLFKLETWLVLLFVSFFIGEIFFMIGGIAKTPRSRYSGKDYWTK